MRLFSIRYGDCCHPRFILIIASDAERAKDMLDVWANEDFVDDWDDDYRLVYRESFFVNEIDLDVSGEKSERILGRA